MQTSPGASARLLPGNSRSRPCESIEKEVRQLAPGRFERDIEAAIALQVEHPVHATVGLPGPEGDGTDVR